MTVEVSCTIVRCERPSLWKQHREQILSVIALVVLQSGLIVALLLLARSRRRAEKSLPEGEERYRNVGETRTELICRSLPDTTLTFVNDAYCRYFGRSRNELVGTSFTALIPEPERARCPQVHGIDPARSADRNLRAPGPEAGWQHRLAAMDRPRDPQCRTVELQGIGRDITELKVAELEAKERRQEGTHLTRVAIPGELIVLPLSLNT